MLYRLLLFFFCLISGFLSAQKEAIPQRFKAGIIAGFTTAQIDGDDSAGFHKFGLVGGLRGVTIINENMEVSLEMLFSQRGSRSVSSENVVPFKINLNYIEVPVLFNYLDWLEGDGEYYKLHFHAGLSYGRLISFEIDDGSTNSALVRLGNFFRDNDLNWVLGATFYANKHLGITARYSRSLFPIFEPDDSDPNRPNADPLTGYYFTFHTVYMF
ncbi:MAG: porin family protein [Bacteroidota bacterium]